MIARLALAAGVAAVGASASAAAAPVPVLSPYLDLGDAGTQPQVGKLVRGYAGAWSGSPTGYTYSWESCQSGTCRPIPGATGANFTPTTAEVGRGLRLNVVARSADGDAAAYTSVSPDVAPIPPAPAADPPAPVPGPSPAPAVPAPVAQTLPVTPSPGATVITPSTPVGMPVAAPAAGTATAAPAVRVAVTRWGRMAGFGGTIRVAGSVGAGAPGRRVTILDGGGEPVADAVADADGAFEARATARRPGTWNVRLDGATAGFEVRVRPRVLDVSASRSVARPGVVWLRGRLQPAVEGKVVDLQYLDPRRGWRVWRQARTGTGGRFRVARVLAANPAVRPFRLRVRAGVPADVGWMFAPAVSASRVVRVR